MAGGYQCTFCQQPIRFKDRIPYNQDGSRHTCKRDGAAPGKAEPAEVPQEAKLYAMAAMNAIISASIQSGGVDFVHKLYFPDVADAAWRAAAAMVEAEKNYRDEFGG